MSKKTTKKATTKKSAKKKTTTKKATTKKTKTSTAPKMKPLSFTYSQAGFEKAIDASMSLYGDATIDLQEKRDPTKGVPIHMLMFTLLLGGYLQIGRWINIWGPKTVGKSTILGHILACCQHVGVPQIMFDLERGLDVYYLNQQGARPTKKAGFRHLQPEYGEQVYLQLADILRAMQKPTLAQVRKQKYPLAMVFIDSLAAMLTKGIDEAGLDDSTLAFVARMHARMIPMISSRLSSRGVSVFTTNQARTRPMAFGDPTYEAASNALYHATDVSIKVEPHVHGSKRCTVSAGEKEPGGISAMPGLFGAKYRAQHGTAMCVKNRLFSPWLPIEYHINLGKGLCGIADSVAYLYATDQLVKGDGGRYAVRIIGTDQTMKFHGWVDLTETVSSPEFRAEYLWPQLRDGATTGFSAFLEKHNQHLSNQAGDSSQTDFVAHMRHQEAKLHAEQDELLRRLELEAKEHDEPVVVNADLLKPENDEQALEAIEVEGNKLHEILNDKRAGRVRTAVPAKAPVSRKKKTSTRKKTTSKKKTSTRKKTTSKKTGARRKTKAKAA